MSVGECVCEGGGEGRCSKCLWVSVCVKEGERGGAASVCVIMRHYQDCITTCVCVCVCGGGGGEGRRQE